jgi:hypothetical protein
VHPDSNTPSKRETICLVSRTAVNYKEFSTHLANELAGDTVGLDLCFVSSDQIFAMGECTRHDERPLADGTLLSRDGLGAFEEDGVLAGFSHELDSTPKLPDPTTRRLCVIARPTYPRTWHNRQRRLQRQYQLQSEEPSGQGEWTWPGLNGVVSAGVQNVVGWGDKGSFSPELREAARRPGESAGDAKPPLGDHVPARTELANILVEREVLFWARCVGKKEE